MLHHHLLPVPGTGRERNVVYDAGDAIECLLRAGVHLVLSGHKHVPYAWRLENLFVVNTGTVSSLRLRGNTRPCYNVVEINGTHVSISRRHPFHGEERIIQFSTETYEYEKYTGRIEREVTTRKVRRVVAIVDGEHYPPVVRGSARRSSATSSLPPCSSAAPRSCVTTRRSTASRSSPRSSGDRTPRTRPRARSLRRARPRTARALRVGEPRPRARAPLRGAGLSLRPADLRLRWSCRRSPSSEPASASGRPPSPVTSRAGSPPRGGSSSSPWVAGARLTPETVLVAPTIEGLLQLSRDGRHAASDHLETALVAGVPTVGCRRCGGGLAGAVAVSNVARGDGRRRVARPAARDRRRQRRGTSSGRGAIGGCSSRRRRSPSRWRPGT